MDILFYAGLAATGFTAGLLGALLGLGGGVFVVPALVLGFRLPALVAVGTSNLAVIATSTAGASSYVHNRLTNIRLALILLVPTTVAALVSSLVASYLPEQVLSGLFAIMLIYTSYTMFRNQKVAPPKTEEMDKEDAAYDTLDLGGVHYDPASGTVEKYTPRRIREGMSVNALAGVVAGLLGVGGGIVQMPVMNLLMGVPLKVAAGTSNFMIGVTATSSAFVRYAHGDIDPLIAVPTALFVFLGARVGAWLVPRTPNALLRRIFGWVAIVIAVLMVLQAVGIYQPPKR
jgi:uncharacterized membrane protein YfcA